MSTRCVSLALLTFGPFAILAALLIPRVNVSAVRVDATVQSDLTASACNGATLRVSFPWHGRVIAEDDRSQACNRDYRRGDTLVLYVASNDPADPGPDAAWVLDPSAHDPFDVIGPNGVPALVGALGVLAVAAGAVFWLVQQREAAGLGVRD